MKITKSLKQSLLLILFQISIGQLSDLDAIADALQAIVNEARSQSATS
jgi:hypothetical protein